MNSVPNTYSSPAPFTTPAYVAPAPAYSFLGLSLTMWVVIILVLAFLGFNIFTYLAKGTQGFADLFGPWVRYFSGLIGNTAADVTKNVTTTAATGTNAGVDLLAGAVTGGVDVVQQVAGAIVPTGATAASSITGGVPTRATVPSYDSSSQNNQLNAALKQQTQHSGGFSADDATSAIQSNKSSSKSGWCYIGEDRGSRSCVQVGENDRCMSGDIFPSQDICVNPSLRA